MKKFHYSNEDIQKVLEIPITEVASSMGLNLIKQGNVYTTKEMDSLKIYPGTNTFFRFSTEESGNVINFVEAIQGANFNEAMKFLTDMSGFSFNKSLETNKIFEEKKDFRLPKLNKNIKRAYAYLINSRKISKEVVNEFVKLGMIREDINHNVLFIGKNKEGNPKYCTLTGTLSDVKYKGEVANSDKKYGFKLKNNSKTVLVFESPIDLLSAKTIFKARGIDNNYSYISLGGVSTLALEEFLKEEKIEKIVCFLDKDVRGIDATEKIKSIYGLNYEIIDASNSYGVYKDVNEWLQNTEIKDMKFNIQSSPNIEESKNLIEEDNKFDLKEFQKEIEKEILSDTSKYVDFLKVMGENSMKDINTQFMIYEVYPNATICLSKDEWNDLNRSLIQNPKPIEILEDKNIVEIYDIEETEVLDGLEDKYIPNLNKKDINLRVLDNILYINKINFNRSESEITKVEKLINFYIDKINLNLSSEQKEFFIESLKISMLNKLKLDYNPNTNLLKNTLNTVNRDALYKLNRYLNVFNRNIISNLQKIEIKVLTKDKNNDIMKLSNINTLKGEIQDERSNNKQHNIQRTESTIAIENNKNDRGRTGQLRTRYLERADNQRGRKWDMDNGTLSNRLPGLSNNSNRNSFGVRFSLPNRREYRFLWGLQHNRRNGENKNRISTENRSLDEEKRIEEYSENLRNATLDSGRNIGKDNGGENTRDELFNTEFSNDNRSRENVISSTQQRYNQIHLFDSNVDELQRTDETQQVFRPHSRNAKSSGRILENRMEQESRKLETSQVLSNNDRTRERKLEDRDNDGYRERNNVSNSPSLNIEKEKVDENSSAFFDEIKKDKIIQHNVETKQMSFTDLSNDEKIESKKEILINNGTGNDKNNIENFEINKNKDNEVDKFLNDKNNSGNYEIYKLSEHEKQIERQVEQESFIDKFNPEIDQMMDRYDVPREAAENLLRGKEDLKNLGYEPNKEKLSFARNYDLKNHIYSEYLTPSERLDKNIKAIKMLKRLENENRSPREYEQAYLADYLGWGGLADVFDETKVGGQWEIARNFLKENLSKEEYQQARESTLTAFYTPKIVIDNMYSILQNLGFNGGKILEPAMGIGNFLGNVPSDLKNNTIFRGVELDSISGRIARQLYPNAKIKIKGFEETYFSNNFFEAAIGNIPFGNIKVNDKDYNKYNFLIHDYFFAKTIDKVKKGGLIAFVTSSGTLDKKDDSVRKYISKKCEFVGALRLPDTTFKGMAGTTVTSDIIFLRKREEEKELEESFLKLDTDENGLTYNKYFVDNPNMVLGKMVKESGRFGDIVVCKSNGESLENSFKNVVENFKHFKKDFGQFDQNNNLLEDIDKEKLNVDLENIKNFTFIERNNKIFYKENEELILQNLNNSDIQKIKDYIELNNSLREVIRLQSEDFDDYTIKIEQEKLNSIYDNFYKKYGSLNTRINRKLLREDSNYPLVSSIEVLEDNKFKRKSDIFFKRTIKKSIDVTNVDTPQEALILSLSEKGSVNLEYMENLCGISKEDLIEKLKGEIFLDIESTFEYNEQDIKNNLQNLDKAKFVSKDEYLSGDIREKIDLIDQYLLRYSYKEVESLTPEEKQEFDLLNYQKDRLERVLPKSLKANEINVELGASWIPPRYIKDFMKETFKMNFKERTSIDVHFNNFTGEWKISNKSVGKFNYVANRTYGTNRINAYNILEKSLNLQNIMIYDLDSNDKKVLNHKETILANEKQTMLNEEFKRWIFKNISRREDLEKIYNRKFNSIRPREYNGENLTFKGKNENITLKPHQLNAIARILYGGNTLLAHVVGAGKTFEMIAAAMESKRIKLCNKSLFVVPNHLTEQMGREFMTLYPGANILVTTRKDFEKTNRKRFLGKIATGEYDAIIIGHSQFEKIAMSKQYQEEYIQNIINEYEDFIRENRNEQDEGSRITVKQLEAKKKNLQTKLQKIHDDSKKDTDTLTFEELGIDRMFVDEAHSFKNLGIKTKMGNVAGISTTDAQKSNDMFMKCRYMDEKTNGKGIVFATGTPVSNSMTELYTMQRYLQYDTLKAKDIDIFDCWASTYGKTVTSLELSPEGTGYRSKTRFSKFYNLPDLMNIFKMVADIKTADMLDLDVPKSKFTTIKTKPTEEQREILSILSNRADIVRNGLIEPTEDNMLKITNDGKKLALDQRLIDDSLEDYSNSKVNICINNVFDIWNKTKENKSTQLIFCDMSTPSKTFNVYDDIKSKLIERGISENEIAFIHDAKTEKEKETLFEKVRKGDIRILIGSTAKCGAGTNIQNKLIAMHDLDVPWRPSDLEQRAGRIVRQGNENKEVEIFRYITEDTFDGYLWQTIENKQRFISQIMTSKSPLRSMDDVDESTLSYAEIKALAIGNPYIKQKMDLEVEIGKLKLLESSYNANLYDLESKVKNDYPIGISMLENSIKSVENDINRAKISNNKEFNGIFILDKNYKIEKEVDKTLLEISKTINLTNNKIKIGKYENFDLEMFYDFQKNNHYLKLLGEKNYETRLLKTGGNIEKLNDLILSIKDNKKILEEHLKNKKAEFEVAKEDIKKPFEKEEELKEKILELSKINKILDLDGTKISLEDEKDLNKTKEEILNLYNKVNNTDKSIDNFEDIFPNSKEIFIKDNKNNSYFKFDLETCSSKIKIDNNVVEKVYEYDEELDLSPLTQLKNEIKLFIEDFKTLNIDKVENITKTWCR
ncbi:helicase protein [Parvimonas sp. KA00067]|uniref:DUF3991 domain-containing protein n=1 Tax=Parvimonas sp. KA00067 TaxID=1588755 RepID=UPI00079A5434|nr:DUF3991 domain-containing protein [Parvimonas sp. KA00067]KXB67920.1 helicase protein [Parvimonas sp. KA00067]